MSKEQFKMRSLIPTFLTAVEREEWIFREKTRMLLELTRKAVSKSDNFTIDMKFEEYNHTVNFSAPQEHRLDMIAWITT